MKRLPLTCADEVPAAAAAAAEVIRDGGVVLIPTETFYGLGAAPDSQNAISKIFALKDRPRQMALPVLCSDWSQVESLAEIPEIFRVRLSRTWPGPLTVILPCRRQIAATTADTIAVRIPGFALLRALLYQVGPLTGTSANLHGKPAATDADQALASIAGSPDLVLDGGTCPGGLASTIVDISGDAPKVLRPGPASWF
jgi:tRNA threonylcarbamoyl adenosine modification protein (Sua5/YciO/YrdC/YwlC family)